ncbi:hypothetical protein [Neoroseomonas soli]|uniref:Uncharacterized protein n=1 Tax=Neoroseomonas soli TaxID=1081025 RepID=A0A9X9X0I1_9PROT|nr:hypothetical protein [Neoroseomonas soli]MBR0672910.1 hypothetical protein [Neoroseomonas soli]
MNAAIKVSLTLEQVKVRIAEGVKGYFDAGRLVPLPEGEKGGTPSSEFYLDYVNWASKQGFPVVGSAVGFGLYITARHPEWTIRRARKDQREGNPVSVRAVRWADGVTPYAD